jgi:hypothetical protein
MLKKSVASIFSVESAAMDPGILWKLWYLSGRRHAIISHKSVILSMRAILKVISGHFGQLM